VSHPFPSLAWMAAYAERVAAHPRAGDIAASLHGRYRFTVTPGGGVAESEAYDLVVDPGGAVTAEPAGSAAPDLGITASADRWQGIITGKADVVLSFLMRRIKVEGDLGAVRSRLSDAKPLLDCLQQVPTTFR
jgi:hypothetical protein